MKRPHRNCEIVLSDRAGLQTNSRPQSIYRRMLASTSLYAISTFAGRAASFLLFPVYTRFLTPADYGVLELLDLTLYAYGLLFGMRIGDALLFRWSGAREHGEKSAVLGSCYWGVVLLGLSSLAVGWVLSGWLSRLVFGVEDYQHGFVLMFCAFAASLPLEVGLAFTRAQDKPLHYVALSLGRLVVTASFNIYFVVALRWGYQAMLWGNLIGSSVLSIAVLVYIAMGGYRWSSFRWSELRRLLVYGAPLGAGSLGMLIIHYGDRFFLRQYVSLAEIGIYALAYKIGMLVSYLQMPFDIYWRAQMFHIVKEPQGERIYVRVCTYLALSLMGFVVFLLGFVTPLLNVLAGEEFRSASRYVPLIAFAYVIRTVGAHFRNAFLLVGATGKEALVVWVGALVCLGGYALLIPYMGLWGAVLATLLAFSVMFVMGFWQAQRVRHFHFEYRRLVLSAVAAAPAALAFASLRPQGWLWQVLLGMGVVASYAALLFVARFWEPDEREFIRRAVSRVLSGWEARIRRAMHQGRG